MSVQGLLLVAHGSKDPEWTVPFREIEASAQREFPGPIVLTYLESATPSVAQGIDQLLSDGATQITVAPLFFAVGSHVRTDIPTLLRQAAEQHPQVTFNVLPAVGLLPAVQRLISAEIIAQASPERIPGLDELSQTVSVSAQIGVHHLQRAADLGYRSVICNRPDDEEGEQQTSHRQIARECSRLGLKFVYYPVSPNDYSEQQARDMREFVTTLPAPVLVYCRSGRRSKKLLTLSDHLSDLYHPESFS
jgi:uncharacterized protein (TIGR01244 family)